MSKTVKDLKILVVEDDFILALALMDTLERADAIMIGPVPSIGEALAALDLLPDIATLDIRLGREMSFPVADELARCGIPFVFVTGSPELIPVAYSNRPVCLSLSRRTPF